MTETIVPRASAVYGWRTITANELVGSLMRTNRPISRHGRGLGMAPALLDAGSETGGDLLACVRCWGAYDADPNDETEAWEWREVVATADARDVIWTWTCDVAEHALTRFVSGDPDVRLREAIARRQRALAGEATPDATAGETAAWESMTALRAASRVAWALSWASSEWDAMARTAANVTEAIAVAFPTRDARRAADDAERAARAADERAVWRSHPDAEATRQAHAARKQLNADLTHRVIALPAFAPFAPFAPYLTPEVSR